MAKLILQPQFGTIDSSKKVKYNIQGLDSLRDGEQYRIDFENTTFACKISSDEKYLNLNIPVHSSQSAISVFANIFVIDNSGNISLKEICPAIFSIQEKVVNKFSGELQVSPIFASPKDLCSIKISSCKPNSRTIFSINDRRLSVIANDDGNGSIHFSGNDMLDKDATSVQKIPIYFYSEDDNYVRKNFTGSYINLLPQEIATFAEAQVDPRCTDVNYVSGDWNYTDDALVECFGDKKPEGGGSIDIVVGSVDIITQSKGDGGTIQVNNGCRINDHSIAILNNGRIVHVYINIDRLITDTSSPYYNKNKVVVVDNNSSVTVPIIANVNVSIAPKASNDDFDIYVDKDIYDVLFDVEYNPSAAYISILFYDESIGYQSAIVTGRRTDWIIDPEAPSVAGDGLYYIITAEDKNIGARIRDWLFCVNVSFYKGSVRSDTIIDIDSDINNVLGYVIDSNDVVLQTNNVSVASNKNYLSTYDESFIYLVAESFRDGEAQLFFASAAVGAEYEANTQEDLYFGWKQITFSGNNINPKAYVDDTNTLHVFWESDRSGSWKVYYGCLGFSNESMTNSVFASMVDKQVELFDNDDKSSDYLSQNLLEDKTIDDPSDPIPSSTVSDILNVTEWQDNSGGNGVVTHKSSQNVLGKIIISANAIDGGAISFIQIPVYDIDREPGGNNSLPYSQINYQVSFNLTMNVTQPSRLLSNWDSMVLDNKDVDVVFNDWKKEFVGYVNTNTSNVPTYSRNGNVFTLGRQDGIFDKIVPFYGAYDTSSALGDPSNDIVDFKAKILKVDNTLKDCMFGFMLEKSRFKATNIRSADEHNLLSEDEYISEEEHIIFTGRAKLVAFINTEDDNSERSNYCILREFPDAFSILGTNYYEIVTNYMKIGSEEVANVLDSFNTEYVNRFAGRVSLLIDGDAKFSQSFVSSLSYDNTYFDIGLGIPFGGYLVSDKMTPSTSGLFDNVSVNMSYNNIDITSPTYSYNPDIVYLPATVTDMTDLRVPDIEYNPSVSFEYNLLNLGIRDIETTIFTQNVIRAPGEWNQDYDVSDINKLTFVLNSGGGAIKDGITVTDTDTGNIIYTTGLIRTSFLSGGVFTEDISLAVYNNINIELMQENNSGYVELDLYFKSTDYENMFSQIPISMEGICKAPNIAYGTCNDAHLVWQSNLNNYWDVYYSNATDKLRPFRFDTRITNTNSNSIMPAVSVNRNGKRMIVWHDNRNGSFDIYSAKSLDGYSCDETFCQNKMTQPFIEEITQCSLSFNYEAATAGFYNFSFNFYWDSGLNNLFKTISSSDDDDDDDDDAGWFVDGVDFGGLLATSTSGELGIRLSFGESVTISYVPNKEDGIFDKILYTKLVGTEV